MAWRQPPCATFPPLSCAPLVPWVLAPAKLTTRPGPRTPSRQAVTARCAWIACPAARNLPPIILWSAKGRSPAVNACRSLTGIGSLRANLRDGAGEGRRRRESRYPPAMHTWLICCTSGLVTSRTCRTHRS
jgi:hypothetical protein